MENIQKELFSFLKSIGIDPMIFFAFIMIVWVAKDAYDYKKNKKWKQERFMVKFSFINRVVGMILIILANIIIYYKNHK